MKTISITLSESETLSVINSLADEYFLLCDKEYTASADCTWKLRDYIKRQYLNQL